MRHVQKCRCGKIIKRGALCGGCRRDADRAAAPIRAERLLQAVSLVRHQATPMIPAAAANILASVAAEQLATAWGARRNPRNARHP